VKHIETSQSVIRKDADVGGRARVTSDEELLFLSGGRGGVKGVKYINWAHSMGP